MYVFFKILLAVALLGILCIAAIDYMDSAPTPTITDFIRQTGALIGSFIALSIAVTSSWTLMQKEEKERKEFQRKIVTAFLMELERDAPRYYKLGEILKKTNKLKGPITLGVSRPIFNSLKAKIPELSESAITTIIKYERSLIECLNNVSKEHSKSPSGSANLAEAALHAGTVCVHYGGALKYPDKSSKEAFEQMAKDVKLPQAEPRMSFDI